MKSCFSTRTILTQLPMVVGCLGIMASCCGGETPSAELPMAHDEYVYMIRFSPNGKSLVTAAGDNVATVWDWSTHQRKYTLEHDAAVYAAEFSPTEDLIATGSGDGKISLWTASTGTLAAQQQQHADAIYCLSFAADGKRLASIGGDGRMGDTRCRVWSVPSLKVNRTLPGHERPAYGVLFGPLATESPIFTSGGDKLIHCYAGDDDSRRTFEGHTSDVYRCCVSPDGKQLASTSQDGSVRLWDLASGKQEAVLLESKDPTYDVTYSRDGAILAAVGDDGYVRFWLTKTQQLLLELKTDKEGLYSVVFSPDQISVVTGGVRGQLFQCDVPTPPSATAIETNQRGVNGPSQ